MQQCLLVGVTNAGKTLLTINFAEYIGLKQISFTYSYPGKKETYRAFSSITQARYELVSGELHKTKTLQRVNLDFPIGKGKRGISLIDSCGLIDGIHPSSDIRQGMGQTIGMIKQSDLLLHVIDADNAGKTKKISDIDKYVAEYGFVRGRYVILVNKMDLPYGYEGLAILRRDFPQHFLIPVSALKRTGFKEVKTYLANNL